MGLIFPPVSASVNEAQSLPRDFYIDPEVFEFEKDSIFRQEWLAVTRVDQIPNPGDYITYDLLGDEIVITRDEQGCIQAFSNVCLHRGCPIVTGRGHVQSKLIACPYHNWVYQLDGQLRVTPQMDQSRGFDASSLRLPAVAVEEWQGWVFINLDTAAEPLAPRVEELAQRLDPWGFAELKTVHTLSFASPWNWKIMVDNFMESYHHSATHPQTLDALFPGRGTYAEKTRGDYLLLENPSIDKKNIPSFWVGCILPFNLFSLIRAPGAVSGSWYQIHLEDYQHFRLDIHILADQNQAKDAALVEELVATFRAIHLEDISICKAVWKGLNSRFYQPGRLSHLETCLWQFQNYLRKKLS